MLLAGGCGRVSLWLDVRNGARGTQLGGRRLAAAVIRARQARRAIAV